LVATYVVLFAVGACAAVIAAFLVPQRLAGGVEGLSVVIAFVGNLGVGFLGGWGTRSVLGAVLPAVGWFLAFSITTFAGPGGDIVIPGRLPADPGVVKVGSVVWLVGVLAGFVPIPLTSRYTARRNAPKGQS
jgi:hypothetical protein